MKKTLLNLFVLFFAGTLMTLAQTNVALGKTVTCTRVTGPSDGPPVVENDVAYLVDGESLSPDGTTEIGRYVSWTRATGGVNVDIDLGGDFEISSYKWYTATSNTATSYGGAISDFTFQVWDDTANGGAGDYVTVDTVTGNGTIPFEGTFTAVTTDKIRINSTDGSGGFVRYTEVEVFTAPDGFDGDEDIVSISAGALGAVLDNGAGTINGLWPGETADELLDNISLNIGVSIEVLEADGVTSVSGTTDLTTGMIVRTTSPFDSDTKDYTITLAALTNYASGVTPTLTSTTVEDPVYEGLGSTSLAGITDGIVETSGATRFLYQVYQGGAQVRDFPVTFTFDLGSSTSINGFKMTEAKRASSYTFETWNGASWDVQATIVGAEDPKAYNGLSPNAQISTATFSDVSTTMFRIVITDNTLGTNGTETNRYIRLHELEVFGAASLSVEDREVKEFRMYPNPVNGDYLNLESKSKITSVEVFNLIGKKVAAKYSNNRVNVSNLSSGVYLIKVNNAETLKFVKN